MEVRSLGYQTDLFIHSFDGEVIDRGNYLVIRSPENPAYYWGNFLLFANPPQVGDFSEWRGLFSQEIGVPPDTVHQVFGWDSPEGDEGITQPFIRAGFRCNRDVVLSADDLRPPSRSSGSVSVHALEAESDWEQALENQVICREPEFGEAEYRDFRRLQMARYRQMVLAERGNWFGAFAGDRLVADLGIFHAEGIGRYQSVQTHPEFRRQGIGGALVYEAGLQARAKHALHTLVIVAEEDSGPARLYASVGFSPVEKQIGLEWWPGMDA